MTHRRPQLPAVDTDLSGSWCHRDPVSTAQMEAISLVTPVLEGFFMRTIAEALPRPYQKDELSQRCLDFIREEANHSRAHRAFNVVLLKHLGSKPAGMGMVEWLIAQATKRLSMPSKLLLAAALEHLAAVMSKVYIQQEKDLHIDSEYGRAMFAMHAEEELGHRSVVFDLWASRGATGGWRRLFVMLTILFSGLLFSAISVPSILFRKNGGSRMAAFRDIISFLFSNTGVLLKNAPFKAIFCFVCSDYHPDHLVE